MVKSTTTGRRSRRATGDLPGEATADATGVNPSDGLSQDDGLSRKDGSFREDGPSREDELSWEPEPGAVQPVDQTPDADADAADGLRDTVGDGDAAQAEPAPMADAGTDPEPVTAADAPTDPAPAEGSADATEPPPAETPPPEPYVEPPEQPSELPRSEPMQTTSSQATPVRRGGVLGPVIGGIVAAGIGAGAVLYLFPQGWQPVPADTSALEARLVALEQRDPAPADTGDLPDRIAALEARPEQTDAPAVDLSPLTARLDALEAALAEAAPDPDGGPDLTPLLDRLTVLEDRPVAEPSDLGPLSDRISALESSLPDLIAAATADIRADLTGQAETIAASAEDLAASQARAEATGLLGELGLAADTGAPVPEVLDRLAATQELPPALGVFRTGLPTLAALQVQFPPVARAALAAAPPPPDAGPGDRVMTFLRNQTGARSLAPRDGMDTDAILSRAEAAVRRADLTAALAELDNLPPGPAAAVADWRAQAETRQAALAALTDLSARLGQD